MSLRFTPVHEVMLKNLFILVAKIDSMFINKDKPTFYKGYRVTTNINKISNDVFKRIDDLSTIKYKCDGIIPEGLIELLDEWLSLYKEYSNLEIVYEKINLMGKEYVLLNKNKGFYYSYNDIVYNLVPIDLHNVFMIDGTDVIDIKCKHSMKVFKQFKEDHSDVFHSVRMHMFKNLLDY